MQTLDAGEGGSQNQIRSEMTKRSRLSLGMLVGVVSAFLMSFVLLVAGCFIALYADPGYYEREYTRYDVLSVLPVEMTMSYTDGIMAVSNHMMDYLLHGDEPQDLQIEVSMDDRTQPFFSDREIAHMWDVRLLFRAFIISCFGALALEVLICCMGAYFSRWDVRGFIYDCGRGILIGLSVLIVAIAILVFVASQDFNSAFVTFHHIFFTNDLWLLDPSQDMLINILPEGFFADTAIRIGVIFAVLLSIFVLGDIRMMIRSNVPILSFSRRSP